MKHGKKPTRSQKLLLKKRCLNPENWLVCRATQEGLTIEHRHTGRIKVLPKERSDT